MEAPQVEPQMETQVKPQTEAQEKPSIVTFILDQRLDMFDFIFQRTQIGKYLPTVKNIFKVSIIRDLFKTKPSIVLSNELKIVKLEAPLEMALEIEASFGRLTEDHLTLVGTLNYLNLGEFYGDLVRAAAFNGHIETCKMLLTKVPSIKELHRLRVNLAFKKRPELLFILDEVIQRRLPIEPLAEPLAEPEGQPDGQPDESETEDDDPEWKKLINKIQVACYVQLFIVSVLAGNLESAKHTYTHFHVKDHKFLHWLNAKANERGYLHIVEWLSTLPVDQTMMSDGLAYWMENVLKLT